MDSKDPRRSDKAGAIYAPYAAFPAYRFHPECVISPIDGSFSPSHGRVFANEDQVPDGWTVTPGVADVVAGPKPTKKAAAARAAARADKEAKLVAAGYDAAEVAAAAESDLDDLIAEEAKA